MGNNEMKQEYHEVIVEIVRFDTTDVITTSGLLIIEDIGEGDSRGWDQFDGYDQEK